MMRHLVVALSFALAVAASPARSATLIRDAEIEQTLRSISAPLMQAAGLPSSSINIYIIRDPSMNAFVAGGRNIFLHTGLLMELKSPEELMGVIAHEIGHLAGGHEALRSIALRDARGPALLGMLIGIGVGIAGGGEAGAAVAAGSQGAIIRQFLSNTRAQEASADQAALTYLERAGVDPKGLQSVIEMFRGQEVLTRGSVDPYVLTHPLSTERMSLIDRRVAELAGRSFQLDPSLVYYHARMRAKLEGFLRASRSLDRLEGKPEDELTIYAKAIAYNETGEIAVGLAAMDRLLTIRPNDAFYLELKGQFLREAGRAAEAVDYYRRAVAVAPNLPLLQAGLARSLLHLNRPQADREALEILKRVRNADLADASALRDLATAYARAGDRGMAQLAAAERSALIGDSETAVTQARQAVRLLKNGSPGWLRAQDVLRLDKKD